jgi:acyl carrier protein
MPATVYARLKGLITEQLGVDEDEIAPGASFTADLNAAPEELMELIMTLEEEFGIEVNDEEVAKIIRDAATVQDVVEYIRENLDE